MIFMTEKQNPFLRKYHHPQKEIKNTDMMIVYQYVYAGKASAMEELITHIN